MVGLSNYAQPGQGTNPVDVSFFDNCRKMAIFCTTKEWHTTCTGIRVRRISCALLMMTACLWQLRSVSAAPPELPFKFQDGLLWLEVNVPARTEPLQFLIDTGASVSVLNLNTARQLGLKLGPRVSVQAVGRNLTGNWPVKLKARASQFTWPDQFLALDLSRLARACSRPIDGLIGADFFQDKVVEINYTLEKIRLLEAPGRADTHAIPLEVRPCGFRIPVSVNGGASQWVRLDTGCATAFQWVTSKEPPARCITKMAVGLTELSIPQTMTGVRLGNHQLDTVPTGLHRKPIFPGESGLLGNGVLANFGVIILDAKSGRLFLGR